jgi:hypothetical protein
MSGTTGTPRTSTYLLSNEFQDGQAAGAIVPQYIRDFIASVVAGTITPPVNVNPIRIFTTTPITQISTDSILISNITSSYTGANTVVNLITPTVAGTVITIKDGSGNATANPIQINPSGTATIDGAATLILKWAYSSVDLVWTGSNWNVLRLQQPPMQTTFLIAVNNGSSGTVSFTHSPALYGYGTTAPSLLQISTYDGNTGGTYGANFTVQTAWENSVASIQQSAAFGEVNQAGYFVFGSGSASLSWINVAANGSAFTLQITNSANTGTNPNSYYVSLSNFGS